MNISQRKRISIPIQKGILKGKKIHLPPSRKGHRNITSSLIKEALFQLAENFFGIHFDGYKKYSISFYDLCAGSGQIGMEAFSRGFHKVHIVEKDKKRFEFLLENLKTFKIHKSKLFFHNKDFVRFAKIIPKDSYSVSFIDLPYSFWKEQNCSHLDFFFKKFFEYLNQEKHERKKILIMIQSPYPYQFYIDQYVNEVINIKKEYKHYRKHYLNLIKINLTLKNIKKI